MYSRIQKLVTASQSSDRDELPSVMKATIVVAFAVSLIYFVPKAIFPNGSSSADFTYFWLAGKIWLAGENPYSASYAIMSKEIFSNVAKVPEQWGYPPHWYALLAPLALFKFETSSYIWQLANFLFLIFGSWAFLAIIKPNYHRNFKYLFMTLMAYVFMLQASAQAISVGQNSILIYFGLSILVLGYEKRFSWVMVAGLVILSLKPHIGIVFYCFLIFHKNFRKEVIIATFVVGLLCLPAIAIIGFDSLLTSIEYILQKTSEYQGVQINNTASITGMGHLVLVLTGIDINYSVQIIVAAVLSLVCGFVANLKKIGWCNNHHNWIYFLICFTAVMVPLHTYDLIIVSFLIPLIMLFGPQTRFFTLLGLLLIFRSANVADITGLYLEQTSPYVLGTTVSTIGLLSLMVGLVISILQANRRENVAINTS